MLGIGIIYKITNFVNGKSYIGQTWQNLQKRFNDHINKKSHCVKLSNAINKYGKNNFGIVDIIYCDNQQEMNFLENFYIIQFDTIKNDYNLREGRANGKLSEESKIKMSKSHIGKKLSDQTKNKLSQIHKGKIISKETRNKISIANSGKKYGPQSEDVRLKKSIALKNRKLSDDTKKKSSSAAVKRKSKISLEDANNIKILKNKGFPVKDLASKFDVSESYVRGIINGNRRSIK